MAGEMFRAARELSRALPQAKIRRRAGVVVSVQTGYTCTVQIAGDTTSISGVRYFSHAAPRPGSQVWIDTDGYDVVVVGLIAGNGGSTPSCRLFRGSQQGSITGPTTILWNQVGSDPWGMRDATNTDRIYLKADGFYLVSGVVAFAASATGTYRAVDVKLNGVTVLQRCRISNAPTAENVFLSYATGFYGVVGDYITVEASSSAYSVSLAQTGQMPNVSVSYIGPMA